MDDELMECQREKEKLEKNLAMCQQEIRRLHQVVRNCVLKNNRLEEILKAKMQMENTSDDGKRNLQEIWDYLKNPNRE